MTKAELIVEEFEKDLSRRKGLGDEWFGIDEDIQDEIRDTWIDLVKRILADE